MFSIALQRKIKVQDFKSYPLQFPFKEPSCLTRTTPTMMKEMSQMHDEDAHDDNLKFSTTPLLPTILLPRATSVNTASVAPPCVEYDEAGFDIHANLAGYTELEIAKALARHSVEIGLPKHYAPNHLVPEGKMCVVAVKA